MSSSFVLGTEQSKQQHKQHILTVSRLTASHYMMSLNLSLQGHTYTAGKPQEGVVIILQQNYKMEMCGKHNFSITIQK